MTPDSEKAKVNEKKRSWVMYVDVYDEDYIQLFRTRRIADIMGADMRKIKKVKVTEL